MLHAANDGRMDNDVLQFYGPACELASAEEADINVTYVCKYADQ